MRDALPELGVQGRIGVTTGEVVTGTEERLATGDAVNVAARLQQAAQPGEILIGSETHALVRDAAEVEAVDPLALKGKAQTVAAYRLVAVRGDAGHARRVDSAMVGRERELRLLADAWDRAVSERSCHLFTLLGAAGVGKSRLAAEFLGLLDEALVDQGRCLSYGEGITYWPVVEVAKQMAEVGPDQIVPETIGAVLGDRVVSSSDEIAWAFRKLPEAVAAEAPPVCVFDDVHWGEETFLDLVEHVADLSRDAPILLLCMARPDLLARRPGWAGGKVNATNVLLEPLGPEETGLLIESLAHLDGGLRERIREAAEGNPLYVEEMVAMVRESPGGEIVLPPTIQALLAARIDQLDPPERDVLQRGAVEGRTFHRGAVQALAPDEPQVAARLTSLVRKELVRPDKAQLPGEDAFRFRHLLIRDAAYDALPKSTRAALHERFAAWLEEHGSDLVELEEILGYHLEQASKYQVELGGGEQAVAARARARLAAAGRRALLREDFPAALGLLERSLALVPATEMDMTLEFDRTMAIFFGGGVSDAYAAARLVEQRAAAIGEPGLVLVARVREAWLRLFAEPEGASVELTSLLEEVLPVFETAGDDFALYVASSAGAVVANNRAQVDAALEAYELALLHARRAGLPHLEIPLRSGLASARFFGSTPFADVLDWIDDEEAAGGRHDFLESLRAGTLALLGRVEEGREVIARLRSELVERGALLSLALVLCQGVATLELDAGDAAAAVAAGEEGCRLLEEAGERGWLSTGAGHLANGLYQLDRLDEAEAWVDRAAELGASDDAVTQMLVRQVKAKIGARRGLGEEAQALDREAVAIANGTQMINAQAEAYLDLGEVLELGGRPEEAAAAVEQALARFGRKGNLLRAEEARSRLERLR
jgi:tetratricopeptide (TPR) repeat protein